MASVELVGLVGEEGVVAGVGRLDAGLDLDQAAQVVGRVGDEAVLGDAAPLQSRITLAFYIYANAFPEGAASRIGMSSAAAILLGVLTLIIVYLQRALGISDRVDR